MAQCLGLGTTTVKGPGSITGQGTKIPQDLPSGQEKNTTTHKKKGFHIEPGLESYVNWLMLQLWLYSPSWLILQRDLTVMINLALSDDSLRSKG